MTLRKLAPALLAAFVFVVTSPATPALQVRAEYDVGALGVQQALLRLQQTASVLHTGAHPDDEDSALIARLARGDHARVAYLSLNRGEGGQNTIGPELFEPLGVIRTEELLQARRLDGGQQLFTRAYDFGFSKSRAETAAFWGEEPILDDMVRAIRTFRPLVVISRFTGTTADGHGHHQEAGYLTPIAVTRAADPAAFPAQLAEGLRPWRTLKVYVGEGFQATGDPATTLRLDTGAFDPLLGRTYFEIAMEGRSQHRSQRQGALELRGDRSSSLRLLDSGVQAGPTDGVFAGIDTSIAGLAQLAGAPSGTLRAELTAVQAAVERALSAYKPLSPADTVPSLVDGLAAVRTAQARVATLGVESAVRAELDFRLKLKADDFEDAIARAAGLVVDPLADRETVAPSEALTVTVRSFYPSTVPVQVVGATIHAPEGWRVESPAAPVPQAGGGAGGGRGAEAARHTAQFRVTVPSDATSTQPYWLMEPRQGSLLTWPVGSPRGEPFAPALMEASVDVRVGGLPLTLHRPVEFRSVDPARGELRRRVDVVPAISVVVNDPLMVVPISPRPTEREVIVRAESLTATAAHGTIALQVPAGWTVKPADAPFSLEAAGERVTARFTVGVPASTSAGAYRVEARATVGDRRYQQTLQTIAYPHVQTHRLYAPAIAHVEVVNLAVPSVRVGYVMGTGDDVAAAIKLMGLPVTLLDADALTSGDLSRFDTIVIGIRASEARPDFVANHKRLLQWVDSGGALIVQYQAPDYADRRLPPFPARIAPPTNDARVTDEEAPVTILKPDHPAFTTPNRIAAGDWFGWVQERSVNDWTTFDARYTALLESHDPGAPPQQGGEEVAQVGRGVYVYTAYAWFRQLPAGVPGAYRLFANLLALGQRPGPTPPMASPQASARSANPLLTPSRLPFQAPPFDKIKDGDFAPAFDEGMKQQRAEVERIANSADPPTFNNTLVALERSGQTLTRVSLDFNALSAANTDEGLQKLEEEIAPKLAAHQDAISLNAKLFARIETLYRTRGQLSLDPESRRLVEYQYQQFVMAGAMLSDRDKALLKALNEEDAALSAKFTNQLLAAAKDGALVVSDQTALAGLSPAEIAAAAEAAKARHLEGQWLISLSNTTQQPLMASLQNRSTRERLFRASLTRAEHGDTNDTRATIGRLAEIRAAKAKLLGQPSFAAWRLQDQMAKTPEAVQGFLDRLVPASVAQAKVEAADIQALIDRQPDRFTFEPWDWNFYSEQVRKAKFDLDVNQIKPYLELDRVLRDGLFFAAQQLYGISFKERHDLPVYQPDVRIFEVFDKDGSHLGLIYFDYFKRDNKNGGAWMDTLVLQSRLLGTRPVIYNVANFAKPAPGQPALVSFDDVTTMFHEFGHGLHGLFASQQYPTLSGTAVARDYVEFPSQFNEHWALDSIVFANYAKHYQTSQPMPQELADKIKRAAKFNQGYALTELLAAASLDMAWHTLPATAATPEAGAFEAAALARAHLDLPQVPPRYRSSCFLHIWANGYAAGYYAYLWTEMLDDDAFAWFEEHGSLTRANGQRFRDVILSKGNTEDYAKMFRDFRGRDPSIEAMLRHRGLKND